MLAAVMTDKATVEIPSPVDGEILWLGAEIGDTVAVGSPIVSGKNLVFSIDGTDKQMVVALDKTNGKVAWQTPRNNKTGANPFSFSTPLLITVDGKQQLIASGSDVVMSLDPKSGDEIWRVKYSGYSVVPKPVFGNGLVYICTGYDNPGLYAIKVDGKGDVTDTHVAWSLKNNQAMPRNASPAVRIGRIHATVAVPAGGVVRHTGVFVFHCIEHVSNLCPSLILRSRCG